MNASDFKARCLAILDEVSRTGESITILKRGKPVALLVPAVGRGSGFPQKRLAGSVTVLGDIVSPVAAPEEWDAVREDGTVMPRGAAPGKRRFRKGTGKVLLDTHVLLWWFGDGGDLSRKQRRILDGARPDAPLLVSDISLFEIALLHQRGRIRLDMALREWLERATAAPLVSRCSISPAVAAETCALPQGFVRDPADRLIAATARVHDASLMTCDRSIIESGAVRTI